MAFLLIIIFCLNCVIFFNHIEINKLNSDTKNVTKPKFSAQNINITTPENKTYIEPMSGYYPATFGFEDVLDDTTPTYVEYNTFGTSPDWVNSYTRVINNKIDGAGNKHNKVLLLKDATSSALALSYLNFTDYGSEIARNSTFEFYHLLNIPGTHYISRIVFSGNYGELFQVLFETNTLVIKYINNSGTYSTGLNLVRDRWYRYSIDISCDGGYAGLSANQFRFRIYDDKGILIYTSYDMDFINSHPTGGPNRITMVSSETQTQEYQYLDAFSITGLQDNYVIGDNLNEGLLLSFENSIALDWIGYSLDGQSNRTIMGNSTIPLPIDGLHSIRVFGNDSLGTIHQSNIRRFSVYSINIITPEDKVYSKAMSGYYPATYGFESDKYGEQAQGWWTENEPGCDSQILDSYDGHNNVYELYDNSGSAKADVINNFENKTYGTIELWFELGTSDYHAGIVVGFREPYKSKISFQITPGANLLARNGTVLIAMPEFGIIKNNSWYHLRFDFRAEGAPYYMGLSEDSYMMYLNGAKANSELLCNPVESGFPFNSLQFSTGGGSSPDYLVYFDSIGYSWDPNYNIGDNLYEGLLLSYENNTNLDWIGYSLDNQQNRTILGNTTIPMPEDGIHNIQVFGKALGTTHQSDKRYFTVDFPIDIITPEEKIYNGPMSGYYPATYGFENVKDGALPNDWAFNWDGTSYVEVDDTKDGHHKVLEVRKIDDGAQYSGGTKNFENNATAGTVELWLYKDTNGGTDATKIDVRGDGGDVRIVIENQDLFRGDYGSRVLIASDVFMINKWYHIRIDFNISQGGWQIQLDNTWYGLGYTLPFKNAPTEFSGFGIGSHWSACNNNYGAWLDALGYSWDPNYNIGDNLNEGLLLSFENSTALDWIGYSLDGQANKTILGNTTIPLPNDGSHVIKVFGNDSIGAIHQSNMRRFSVYSLNIITPEDKIYTEAMSGYYPATYGFENDADGRSPEGWINQDWPVVCTSEIISGIGGHNKTLRQTDNSNGYGAVVNHTFTSALDHGTIEFFARVSVITPGTRLWFDLNSVSGQEIWFVMGDSGIQYWAGGPWYDIIPSGLTANTWYHFSVRWRNTGAPAYEALGEGEWKIFIDGVEYGNYDLVYDDYMTSVNLESGAAPLGHITYWDAIGFDWDPNYNIGDNWYEGLLLSYENRTSLDWQGYSLDGQPINTVMGNTTIPLPDVGQHTIQVFANDSLGLNYYSDIRHFTIANVMDIITPENKTYTEPMSGYYPATYGFEETNTSTLPSYCDYNPGGSIPDGPGSYSKVIDKWTDGAGNTHEKVLKTYDRTGSGTAHGWLNFTNEGSESCRNSTIEFWTCNTLTGVYYHSYFEIWGDLGNMVEFEWESWGTTNDPEIRITPATGEFGTGVYQEWDRWYRYSIDISCDGGYAGLGANQFRFRIYNDTGDLIYTSADLDLKTAHPTGGPYRYHVLSTQSQSDVSHYLDGFGITGLQDDYVIGDNLNEGLLLSFDNSTALDWIGYSLDNQQNRTILGNTTISMPEDGIHNLQVFGETLGTAYQSDKRYFTVDFPIDIITPEDKIYRNGMSGYYPATYGFEDVLDDTTPTYVEYNTFGTNPEWINSYTGVINNKIDGAGNKHNKVLLLKDGSSSALALSYFNFTESGSEIARNSTFEFYYLLNIPGTHYISRIVFSGNKGNLFQIFFETNTLIIKYINSTGTYSTGLNLVRDRWYRYSIDISCDGGYAGLSANQFRFRIYDDKGILIYTSYDMDFETPYPTSGPNRFSMISSETQTQVYEYLDAFSVTGLQDSYEIGDNLNEGLLLSFENSTALDWIGYSLDGQANNTILGNTTISMPSEGVHTIQVFANDLLGTTYQSAIRYFTVNTTQIVDLIAPVITINLPGINTLLGTAAPPYDLTIIETNLNSLWYTLDGGSVNTTITDLNGTIALSIWNNRPNGTVDIRFYADDLSGNVGFEEVEVRKDTLAPQITITNPSQNQVFYDTAPSFDLTIIEGNLDAIWYTLDNGIVEFPCGISGNINNIYWNAIPPGDYTVKFYANDTLGNQGFSEVIIKKKEPDIPGYSPILLSLILVFGIIYITLKIKKKLK